MQDWSYCCDAQLDAGHVAQADDAGGLRHGGRRRRCWPYLAAGRTAGHCDAAWSADVLRQGVALGRLDDDVAELLRVGEPAQGVDGQLELLALGHRLLADLPGGHLQVLLADGGDHVHGAEVRATASLSGSSQARRL